MRSRRPTPPADLAVRLQTKEVGAPSSVALAAEGCVRLAEARAQTGRVRASAFRLLEADALITYACEAALETEDSEAALRSVLAAIRA